MHGKKAFGISLPKIIQRLHMEIRRNTIIILVPVHNYCTAILNREFLLLHMKIANYYSIAHSGSQLDFKSDHQIYMM